MFSLNIFSLNGVLGSNQGLYLEFQFQYYSKIVCGNCNSNSNASLINCNELQWCCSLCSYNCKASVWAQKPGAEDTQSVEMNWGDRGKKTLHTESREEGVWLVGKMCTPQTSWLNTFLTRKTQAGFGIEPRILNPRSPKHEKQERAPSTGQVENCKSGFEDSVFYSLKIVLVFWTENTTSASVVTTGFNRGGEKKTIVLVLTEVDLINENALFFHGVFKNIFSEDLFYLNRKTKWDHTFKTDACPFGIWGGWNYNFFFFCQAKVARSRREIWQTEIVGCF